MDGDRVVTALRGWREAEDGGLLLELDAARGRLSVAADASVRFEAWAEDGTPRALDAALGRAAWRPVAAAVRATQTGLRLACEGSLGSVCVEVDAEPFAIRILDRDGARIARFDALVVGGGGRIDHHVEPGDAFFGFGEKAGGLDKRGERLLMRNRDPELRSGDPRYVSIPFFLALSHERGSARARGVLLDTCGPSRFDVAATRADRVTLESVFDGIDVSVFPGPTPADVVRRFTARVGRTPLPPLWSLGHHQSRWSYASQKRVLAVARALRARRIPSDAIHLDIDHMRGFRDFTWHPKRFPDPKRLMAELAALGLRAVAIVDPGVKVDPDWEVYRDGCEREVFCRRRGGERFTLRVWPGEAALPDFNRPEVRRWWGEQHRPLVDAGVAGIWNDMNEPAGWSRDVRIGRLVVPIRRQDTSALLQSDPAEPQRELAHERVRNVYGQQECRATREFLAEANPGRRPFVLTRSGTTGIQRFAAVWTGDNRSRWSDLRESIPMLLNLSLSGVAHCGADIGGFALPCTPELYARWIQLGALYPFARTHSMWAKPRQEPWSFGPRVEAIARAALELRMRLLPYLYGLFREAEENGAPVWRPLFYEFPDDRDAVAVADQVMLGARLLIAPVLERGAREREVYLPAGRWFAFDDDAAFVGPRRLRIAAPLERLPLFVRAGSVIPTRSPTLHSAEPPREPLVLEVFPGDDSSAVHVEDDGESLEYRDGVEARTGLRLWHRAGGRLRLELSRRTGTHAVAPRVTRVVVHACPEPRGVHLAGLRLTRGDGPPGWRHAEGRLEVRFTDAGEGHTLEIEPAP